MQAHILRPMTYQWHHHGLPWADAVLDTRELQHLSVLPTVLPDPVPGRSISIGDWQVTPYAVSPGGPKGGGISVLTLQAPDGWVGALVMTQFSGRTFTFGRLNDVVPYVGRLMSTRRITAERRQVLTEAALAGLPMLRDAMLDPIGWDIGVGPAADPRGMGGWTTFVATWASCGITEPVASDLDRMLVRPVFSGSDAYSVLGWRSHGYTPEQIIEWFEVGVRSPEVVTEVVEFGFTQATASAWLATPLLPFGAAPVAQTWAFVDAGWTPRALRAIGAMLNEVDGPDLPPSFHQTVVAWTEFAHPVVASRLLAAGIDLETARRLQVAGDLPDAETLDMVAAICDEPTNWQIKTSRRRGAWADPHDRTDALDVARGGADQLR